MKYLVMEIQVYETGAISAPVTAHDTRDAANAKYHHILSGEAVSKLPVHACVMLTSDGQFVKTEKFTHEVAQTAEPA